VLELFICKTEVGLSFKNSLIVPLLDFLFEKSSILIRFVSPLIDMKACMVVSDYLSYSLVS
jgi:hypothetical protein